MVSVDSDSKRLTAHTLSSASSCPQIFGNLQIGTHVEREREIFLVRFFFSLICKRQREINLWIFARRERESEKQDCGNPQVGTERERDIDDQTAISQPVKPFVPLADSTTNLEALILSIIAEL